MTPHERDPCAGRSERTIRPPKTAGITPTTVNARPPSPRAPPTSPHISPARGEGRGEGGRSADICRSPSPSTCARHAAAKAPPWPQPHAATRQQHTQRQQRTLRHGRTFGPGHPIDRSHPRRAGVRLRAPSAAPGCVKRTRRRTASCPRRGGLCVASSLSLDASYALRVDGHPVPAARGQARVRARPSSDGKRPQSGSPPATGPAGPRRRRRLASAGLLGHKTALECGCSSGVEHHVANVRVEGSNPFARSNFPDTGGTQTARRG